MADKANLSGIKTGLLLDMAGLRPNGNTESDLQWYFNTREGEMGLGSNFGAVVHRIETGGRGGSSASPNRGYDARKLAAADREAPIKSAIESLAGYHQDTLRYAYCARTLLDHHGREAHTRLVAYGSLAGLVVVSPTALKEHDASKRTLTEWLERVAKNARRYVTQGKIFNAINREAEERLMAGAGAYERAARAVLRSGRHGW